MGGLGGPCQGPRKTLGLHVGTLLPLTGSAFLGSRGWEGHRL